MIDLIEKLKMELKYARTGGLPTIMEESESPPKTVEELKPLRIDQKFEHKDHMKEIHKFYRSYLDKMRKLDILNSQTMHAIGKFNSSFSFQVMLCTQVQKSQRILLRPWTIKWIYWLEYQPSQRTFTKGLMFSVIRLHKPVIN